jgi:flavin reductase (DIM6/NTAB) family NADH-FMN oxidoreductase RutF
LLAFSINPEHYSYQLLRNGNICSINVLDSKQIPIAEHFGRSGLQDKMRGYEWQQDKTGAPILVQSLCYFDCEVSHYSAAGDHQIVVCKVLNAGLRNKGRPMLYSETGEMDGSEELFSKATKKV